MPNLVSSLVTKTTSCILPLHFIFTDAFLIKDVSRSMKGVKKIGEYLSQAEYVNMVCLL